MGMIEREDVRSSVLRAIGYDEASRTLEVEFRRGAVYQYAEVPPFLYEGLRCSSSKGEFFNTRINGKFRCRELRR